MNKNETDNRNQESDGKSTKQPKQDNLAPIQEKKDNVLENPEEFEEKITNQRRPQFRLKENMKRRFS